MSRLRELKERLQHVEQMQEDYPHQRAEYRRNLIVDLAVAAADEILMEGSDGSTEETDFLTSAAAKAFVNAVAQ